MIVFRHADARYPCLWEHAGQPAGRWHAAGEGPAHYFADTPNGAWAEFLRHEEITDPGDLPTIRRRMWAVEIGEQAATPVALPDKTLTGDPDTYARCQAHARDLRAKGATRLMAPSAALMPGGAAGVRIASGDRTADSRDGRVIVLFTNPDNLIGWIAADDGRPARALLDRVRHYSRGML